MENQNVDRGPFIFRSVLKGIFWSATGTIFSIFIVMAIFALITAFDMGVSPFLEHPVENIANLFIIPLGLSVVAFFLLGIPLFAIPCTGASLILAIALYRDYSLNKLSVKKSKNMGRILGALASIIALLIPIRYFGWPFLWISLINNKDLYPLFWAIVILIPSLAAVTGGYLGENISKELLQSKSDYFSIDWEQLKWDQNNNA